MKKLFKTVMLAVAVMAAGYGGYKTYDAYTSIDKSVTDLLLVVNMKALSEVGPGNAYPDYINHTDTRNLYDRKVDVQYEKDTMGVVKFSYKTEYKRDCVSYSTYCKYKYNKNHTNYCYENLNGIKYACSGWVKNGQTTQVSGYVAPEPPTIPDN